MEMSDYMNVLKPVEDENTKDSLIKKLIVDVSGILAADAMDESTGIAATIIPTIATAVISRIVLPLTSRSEAKRLYQWGTHAAEGIGKRLKNGEEFRKDGFFEETLTNRSNFEEVVESTLKKVIETTDEPKTKFMDKLTQNVHFDQDLDMETYRQLLKDLDDLTYRQLCIIRLVVLCENREVETTHIEPDEEVIEQLSRREQIEFHSMSRDFQEMHGDGYLSGVQCMLTDDGKPCLSSPSLMRSAYPSERLYSFVNLDEIPIEEIFKIFSLWKVKPRDTEI